MALFEMTTKPYQGNLNRSFFVQVHGPSSISPEYMNMQWGGYGGSSGNMDCIHRDDWIKLRDFLNRKFPVEPKELKYYTSGASVYKRVSVPGEMVAQFCTTKEAQEYADFKNEK